jgi:hypothetical protein
MNIEVSKISSVFSDGRGASKFGVREVELEGEQLWRLSQQQQAVNFRLRSSASSYVSDWHVAGDPTLLIILSGAIEIELRNGESQTFRVGDMFVAEDYLQNSETFSDVHGHRAKVVSNESLSALHLKLEKR